jgi:hypothetical protein
MKSCILTVLLFLLNCATANIIPWSDSIQDLSPQLKQELSQKKIAVLGFYPYRDIAIRDASGQELLVHKLDQERSIQNSLLLGKALKNFSNLGEGSLSSETIQEFLKQIRDTEGTLENPDLLLLFPGLESSPKEALKVSKRDVDFYLYGHLGPKDFPSQSKWDFGKGRTWLYLMSSVFSTLTLGTLPAVTYRDLDTAIYIYDPKLYRRSELRSQSQVWMVSGWWVHFFSEKKDRVVTKYWNSNEQYEVYYKSQIHQIPDLFRGILEKDKGNR